MILLWYPAALGIEWLVLVLSGLLFWRWPLKYAALFASLQACAGFGSPLYLLGIPVCAVLSLTRAWHVEGHTIQWPRWAWIWSNEVDGIVAPGEPLTRWNAFTWTALRNSVNNARFVPGVSGKGRPLWYWSGTVFGRLGYAKAGWESDGWPSFSIGGGKGY